MGLLLTRLLTAFGSFSQVSSEYKILILGLDCAGKTTILYKISLKEYLEIPTVGFNVETVSPIKGVSFTVWDVGGSRNTRALWKYYYQNTQGLIYVVDSYDRERISESREELFGILENDEMRGVSVVVIANKQDIPNALSTSEVTDLMSLHKLTSRKWNIQAACATHGEGIFEVMKELSSMVKENKKEIR